MKASKFSEPRIDAVKRNAGISMEACFRFAPAFQTFGQVSPLPRRWNSLR